MRASPPVLDIVYHIELNDAAVVCDDSARIHAAAAWVVQHCSIAELSASISIVDDETIHALNREHLQHDWPTDVISFVFERTETSAGPKIDGEIIVSVDTAERLSAQAGWSPSDELLLYCVHGLLHLAGFDDIEDDQRQEMRIAEQECLIALGIEGSEKHIARWENISY